MEVLSPGRYHVLLLRGTKQCAAQCEAQSNCVKKITSSSALSAIPNSDSANST